jgi:hypothetical protein
MADPVEKPPDPVEKRFDAFISYASVDRRRARRVQRFLESWVDRREGRRLRVFLDETDIRGGSLDEELRRAVHGARTLIICHSQAAADSRWVQREVHLFRDRAEPGRIAVAIVSGKEAPEVAGRELVAGAEFRVHDLRRGWWLGRIGLGVKLELLRLLAFVAEADMRRLRNWHLRRTLAGLFLFAILALLPLWALLSARLDDWEQLELKLGAEPLFAIAAEADGEKLMVASRYRGSGPQGFRDYIQIASDALAENPKVTFNAIAFTRRVLPIAMVPNPLRARIPAIDIGAYTERRAAGKPLVGAVSEDRLILVIPLAPTEEEIDEATDQSYDHGTPIPTVKGSVVAVVENGQLTAVEVSDLSPVWEPREGASGPASPSRGLAFAWSPEGDIWLGMVARDANEAGGLWLRRHGQSRFEKQPGFSSVQSIELELRSGWTHSVRVAEKYAELWRGIRLVPRPTTVVMRTTGESEWREAPAPPFGTRSEVEFVGHLNGARLVRVDGRIYRQRTIPLWRFLLSR